MRLRTTTCVAFGLALIAGSKAMAEPPSSRDAGGSPLSEGVYESDAELDLEAAPVATAPLEDGEGGRAERASSSWLETPPRDGALIDPRFEPIVFPRVSFVYTFASPETLTLPDGSTVELDSQRMDPGNFGFRRGFVIENAEFGAKGRFNDVGLYYQLKLELAPREKDGNRSSDYLKDVLVGWNAYTVFDVRLGRMKIPFSQANMRSTAERLFPYSPTLDTLIPKRQLGLAIAASDPYGIATLRGGVFNSVKLATEQIKDLKQLLYVGRLELSIDALLRDALNIDVGDLAFNLAGHVAYTEEAYDPRTEHRWTGLDLHLHYWRVTLEAEVAFKDFYKSSTIVEETEVVIDGETMTQTQTFQPPDRGWGWHVDLAFELLPRWLDLMVRYERSDGDALERGFNASFAMDELSRRQKEWLSVGVRSEILPDAACQLVYTHRNELEGFVLSDDVMMLTCQYHL